MAPPPHHLRSPRVVVVIFLAVIWTGSWRGFLASSSLSFSSSSCRSWRHLVFLTPSCPHFRGVGLLVVLSSSLHRFDAYSAPSIVVLLLVSCTSSWRCLASSLAVFLAPHPHPLGGVILLIAIIFSASFWRDIGVAFGPSPSLSFSSSLWRFLALPRYHFVVSAWSSSSSSSS